MAVEEANASEQGKGFAIAAHEVKQLAQQSQQATAQVRQLLQEIRKASHTAGLVTEQGGRAMEEVGVTQSIESHHLIKTLSHSINDTPQSVLQIMLSSQEQIVGMDQVVQAMVSVKQVARDSVINLQQIEKAAQRLREVGQTLKALIDNST